MNIRLMSIDDYEEVYSLWMSSKGMGLNNIDESREGIEKYLNRNPKTTFVCEKDNKIVGVIMAGNDGRRGYIHHTAVHPNYRRQGIGTMLVNKVCEALKEVGISKVALVVFDRNKDGNEFWESMGFTKRDDLIYRNKALTELVRIDT